MLGDGAGLNTRRGCALRPLVPLNKTRAISRGGETMTQPDGQFDFDFIIIGSGFGGSVSAHRLTEKGYRVAVMEMGLRWTARICPPATGGFIAGSGGPSWRSADSSTCASSGMSPFCMAAPWAAVRSPTLPPCFGLQARCGRWAPGKAWPTGKPKCPDTIEPLRRCWALPRTNPRTRRRAAAEDSRIPRSRAHVLPHHRRHSPASRWAAGGETVPDPFLRRRRSDEENLHGLRRLHDWAAAKGLKTLSISIIFIWRRNVERGFIRRPKS